MEFKIAPEGIRLRDIDIWGDLYDAMERGSTVEAVITGVLRPKVNLDEQSDENGIVGWELAFENKPGIIGVCSTENSGLPEDAPINVFAGQKIACKIKRIEKKKTTVICSRKEVVEESLNRLIHRIEPGEEINAVVRAISNHLFADIGGGVILRIRQEKARQSAGVPLSVQYEEGAFIRVSVTTLNKDKKYIEVEPVDPWKEQSYKRGDVLAGQVVDIRDNLAFISVKPGIIGRVYYKKTDKYDVGDYIKLQVTDYQPEEHRLHLIGYDVNRVNERRRNKAKNRARKIQQGKSSRDEIKTLGGFNPGSNSEGVSEDA